MTSSNVEHVRQLKNITNITSCLATTHSLLRNAVSVSLQSPWGGVGHIFLAENESRIYPNVCQIWLRSDGRVEAKEEVQTDRQTDRQGDTEALYSRCVTILDCNVRLNGHNV